MAYRVTRGWRKGRRRARRQVEAERDGGERIADLVRDARGDAAEGGEPLVLGELARELLFLHARLFELVGSAAIHGHDGVDRRADEQSRGSGEQSDDLLPGPERRQWTHDVRHEHESVFGQLARSRVDHGSHRDDERATTGRRRLGDDAAVRITAPRSSGSHRIDQARRQSR
jgi:hypothetical protein